MEVEREFEGCRVRFIGSRTMLRRTVNDYVLRHYPRQYMFYAEEEEEVCENAEKDEEDK